MRMSDMKYRFTIDVVIGAHSEQQAQKAVRELQQVGKVSPLVVDVSDSRSTPPAASTFAEVGQLDVLVNNAGIYPDEGTSILTISREQMVSTFQQTHLRHWRSRRRSCRI